MDYIKFIIIFGVLFLNISLTQARTIICPTPGKNAKANQEEEKNFSIMGTKFFEEKFYAEAAESFECVLRFNPQNTIAHFNLARTYDQLGMRKQARERYEWILSSKNAEAKAFKILAQKRLQEIIEEERKEKEKNAMPVALRHRHLDNTHAGEAPRCLSGIQIITCGAA